MHVCCVETHLYSPIILILSLSFLLQTVFLSLLLLLLLEIYNYIIYVCIVKYITVAFYSTHIILQYICNCVINIIIINNQLNYYFFSLFNNNIKKIST